MILAAAQSESPVDSLAVMLIVLGVVVIGVLMMISVRGKIAARQTDRSDPRQTLNAIRQHAARSTDTDAATARLLETAQRVMAQLDAKAERLEQLLADADERIAQLRAVEPGADATIEVKRPRPESLPADPLARSVYELADQGAQPIEIAQQIDEQVGKVELILALRRSHQPSR